MIEMRNITKSLFENLNQEGITIVMITHDPEVAERAPRSLWLRDGLVH